ncbi:hypothetical protein EDB86DRAFT_2904111 [Lactarius hatsudake]|nr:hypothetical protein EDB86DRAFT_2904111 [Lactarius hatsudake]
MRTTVPPLVSLILPSFFSLLPHTIHHPHAMMNNCDLTSNIVDTQREPSRGTKRPRPSLSSQARPDCHASSSTEAEGRSPRRMRMSESPTSSYGGSLAGLNIVVTEIQNTAAPRPQDLYESPAPPQSHPQPRTLPLSPQRRQHQRKQSSPLRVHRPGKRTVYVQDVVFRLLVMSQLETK